MQKELNSVTEHAASRAASANAELENVNEVHSLCLALVCVAVIILHHIVGSGQNPKLL